jgi:UPF0755 protein
MKTFIRILAILFIAAAGVFIWLNSPLLHTIKNVEFKVNAGDSALSAGARLHKAGLIRDRKFFAGLCLITGNSHRLQKGLYLLNDNMSALEILYVIAHGKVYTVRVTIPEGFAVRQIAETLEDKKLISSRQDFITRALAKNNLSKKFSFLKGPNLEGFLFPDTYDFSKTVSIEEILVTMVQHFSNEIITPNRPAIRTNSHPLYDLLKLASIVEKEAKVDMEKHIVAQVYFKRLKKNMTLGSCPTIAYAVGKFKGQHLSLRDLAVDSPFNTYFNNGLPPTPVSNPGTSAFRAVLQPAPTDYLYFVSKNDGTHYFSKTLKEHNKAVRKYQLNIQDETN